MTGMNVVINKVEAALGRPIDPGAQAITGKELAESVLNSLIAAGKSRSQAMAMMSDPAFQEGVLKQLAGIMHVNDSDLKDAQKSITPGLDRYIKQSRELDLTTVEGKRTALQETLTFATNLNEYIKANPEKAEAVGYVLALSQGPKGVLTLLVGGVVSNTTGGQKFSEMMESLQTKAATELAQFMLSTKEGTVELNPADKDDDSLIGGGRLITSILTGGLPGRAKKDSHITVGGGSVNDHPRGDKAGKGEKEKAEKEKAEKEKAEKEKAEREKAEKEKAEKEKAEKEKAEKEKAEKEKAEKEKAEKEKAEKGNEIDIAPMAQRVMDVRAKLPSDLRRSGNVAVAEIDIPGVPNQMAAHSQISVADSGKGLIGSGSGNFVADSVPNKAGDMVRRDIDTEYKILDNIADQLGRNTSAKGTVNILTEKAACASCLNVAEQFRAKYPNITVNIFDNQGVMLRPPRKTP